jgi:hypothetical protein
MPGALVVEDDPTIRAAVMRALTDRGYAVAAAHTAMNGLQLAISDHPDLAAVPEDQRGTLIAVPPPGAFRFDIRLQEPQERVFFGV